YVGAWNVETGDEIFLHSASDVQCGILVNDVFVVCRNDAKLTLYNAIDGTEITTLVVHFSSGITGDLQIYDAAVSPDGTQIALAQAQENELVILGIGEE
ncbi:MAG: hypothetical protein SAK29_40205, partial [Scytonema sp. PMC 1069.18]|nr:hypothetical protein [Scytonema sp. PMC 1069.18]